MKHVSVVRTIVAAAVVCLFVAAGWHVSPTGVAAQEVGNYIVPAFCVGPDLHLGPIPPFVDQSRANGSGPNLPSAWTGPLQDIVVPGPGTWTDLIIELPAGEGGARPAAFLFVEPTTITCPPNGAALPLDVVE